MAQIIPFPKSYDVRLRFARMVERRMAQIEEDERALEAVYEARLPARYADQAGKNEDDLTPCA